MLIFISILWYLVGAWRSPEARLNGVQEVAGSNPVAPILLPVVFEIR